MVESNPGMGHNGADSEQEVFEKHVSAILRNRNGPLALAKAAVKSAMKEEKSLKSLAKADGLKLVQLEQYLALRALDDEGQASENAQALKKYLTWGELLEGEQGDLFDGLSPTPDEAEERWKKRGFSDIREGKLDPEGFFNEATQKHEPGPIFYGSPPSYVPAEYKLAWMDGAERADLLNQKDFLERNKPKDKTPVEEAVSLKEDEESEVDHGDNGGKNHLIDSVLGDLAKEFEA